MHLDHQTAHPHQTPICLPNLSHLKRQHLQYPQLIPNTMKHPTDPKLPHDLCNTAMSYEGLSYSEYGYPKWEHGKCQRLTAY